MKGIQFQPPKAHPGLFRPRAWLAFQPLEERVANAESVPSRPNNDQDNDQRTAHFWGIILFNGGPELTEVVLEIDTGERNKAPMRFEFEYIAAQGRAHVFLGGPSLEPPHGHYRLWAKGTADAPVFLEANFSGFQAGMRLPAAIRELPAYPIAPAANWSWMEYSLILAESSLITGHDPDPSDPMGKAAIRLSRRVELLERELEEIPSHQAAREIIWNALEQLFGALERDADRPELWFLLNQAAAGLRELAIDQAGIHETQEDLPAQRLSLALLPSQPPMLYLVNNTDHGWKNVSVQLERFRWGSVAGLLEPFRFELGSVDARRGVLISNLRNLDTTCLIEVTVQAEDAVTGVLHHWVGQIPAHLAEGLDKAVPVSLLNGRKAMLRSLASVHPWEQGEETLTAGTLGSDHDSGLAA